MRAAIVHLSDIHFSENKNSVQSKLAQLAAAIGSTDPTCQSYLIALTGDIAHGGEASEYATAKTFLSNLDSAIRERQPGANVRFIAVPGNHDCMLPREEEEVREILINALRPRLEAAKPDESILKPLLDCQDAYRKFAKEVCLLDHPTLADSTCTCLTVEVAAGTKFQVNLYNTALLSQRKEKQGQLIVPIGLVQEAIRTLPDCALSISMFHHSYVWIDSDNAMALRKHIETTSDIALMGHQHVPSAFEKRSLDEEFLFYSEGDVLQEGGKENRSGFCIILVNAEERLRRIVTYFWNNSHYVRKEDTDWRSYTRTSSLATRFVPSSEFISKLQDPGIGLTHPIKGPLRLEDVFVYPDVSARGISDSSTPKDIKGSSLFKYLTDHTRLIVQGGTRSGKTSLARAAARDWLFNTQLLPLLVEGQSIKRADQAFLERFVAAECERAYGPGTAERFTQLSPSRKVLVVDDWNRCPLPGPDRDHFLKLAGSYFGRIILFVDDFMFVQQVLGKLNGHETALEFEYLTLKEMSFLGRGQLIERWIGFSLPPDSKEFSREVEETDRLIKSVIGKKTLPSLPFIVLSILEASERSRDIIPENGSFGYLYEVLITTALNASHSKKPQLDKKYAFLTLFAYRLFEGSTDTLGASEMEKLLTEYAKSKRVKIDKEGLLTDLVNAKVLSIVDGNYKFIYSHYLYYFLARYFKNHLNNGEGEELRKRLKEAIENLASDASRTFLMFVIYLTHDDKLTEEVIKVGNRILEEVAPTDLVRDAEYYNVKEPAAMLAIPESFDTSAARQRRREAEDAVAARSKDPSSETLWGDTQRYSSDLSAGEKVKYAMSCLEMLGQILRNFTGSLPGDRKLQILLTTYQLGLRTLATALRELSATAARVRSELARKEQEGQNIRQLAKSTEKLIDILSHILGFSLFRTISHNVGSPEIEDDAYAETLETLGRNDATELIDFAIKLDHWSDEYPLGLFRDLHRRYKKSNRLAQAILRDLAIANMQVIEIGRETRQKVLEELKERPTASLIEATGKRFRN
jgi:predicted phosphodiesterase